MTERVVPNPATLVKYDNPVIFEPEMKVQKKGEWTQKERTSSAGFPAEADVPGLIPGASIPCEDISLSKMEVAEILNIILPPRIWEDQGVIWKQMVYCNPATRVDVLNLQEQLTIRLKQRQAREKGICPVRRELFSQCFEELIRQATINCVERGLLLIRIRDEIRMTMDAHRSLYESSTAFCAKKEQGFGDMAKLEFAKSELENQISTVMAEKNQLQTRLQELKIKMDQVEKRYNEHKEAAEKIHARETDFLKRANLQLQTQLDLIQEKKDKQ